LFRIGWIGFRLDRSDGIVWGKQVFLWVKDFIGGFANSEALVLDFSQRFFDFQDELVFSIQQTKCKAPAFEFTDARPGFLPADPRCLIQTTRTVAGLLPFSGTLALES
jgi:hypothetical protein